MRRRLLYSMGRKKPYKHNARMRRVRVASSVALAALGSGDTVKGAITTAATETYRLLSIKAAYAWTDIQALIDDGFEFGFAHSDYTATEIEECLEAQGAIDLGDKIAQEKSNRLVRSVGRISNTAGVAVGGSEPFNTGRLLKTKLNWVIQTGDTLDMWVRNSSGVVWTTGSFLQAIGDIYIVDT